ncbi:hypothetical protein PHLCEN_2v11670 [Hermanssonia centrifuga]|uniref:Mediator of RNA polymerase II transcription subunit 4 n=1 Tax=Hermanssonia centrifuga TaxID=98765 RepID=A0A2R6NJC5_9APHY|nr:hypothetical protein PHLCEN_2v11670 [Hermanssonia centrifuga]
MAGGEKAGPSSMSEILLQPLQELQTLAQGLFLSLSSTQARTGVAPPASAFLEADASLAATVKLARQHQIKQRKIERLKNEVLALEGHWREIIQELADGKRELEVILTEGDERLNAIGEARTGLYTIATGVFREKVFIAAILLMLHLLLSVYTIPRASCVRAEHLCFYFSAAQYAGSEPSRTASTPLVLSTVSE